MERTNSVMVLLVIIGLLAGTFAATANDALGAEKRLRKLDGWANLNAVAHGRKVRVRSHDGKLFQGRFKAILVQKDSYLLELARYIALNPVRAQMVRNAREWPWSSYRGINGVGVDFQIIFYGKTINDPAPIY